MSFIQRMGRILSNTPLYRPVSVMYKGLETIVERSPISDLLNFYYIGGESLVQVTPKNTEFDPFLIRLEPSGKLQRQRARGIYEPHVMSYLNNKLTDESIFWEFGAAWGYFSLAAATRVRHVCSFEMMDDRVEYLQTSVKANEFDNVTIIDNKLDSETEFTQYPHPDVLLIDIEGWEYVVLSSALEELSDVSTWVVEVHSNMVDVKIEDPVKEIQTLFQTAGYTTNVLNEWSDNNIHIVAEKTSSSLP